MTHDEILALDFVQALRLLTLMSGPQPCNREKAGKPCAHCQQVRWLREVVEQKRPAEAGRSVNPENAK